LDINGPTNSDVVQSPFIRNLNPERWKIFQVLPILGENDEHIEELMITKNQFNNYVNRHKSALSDTDICVIPEDNQSMTGSYAMVDPLGRFFDNVDGRERYSRPILEVGIAQAWSEIRFYKDRFIERGGADYFINEDYGEKVELRHNLVSTPQIKVKGI